MKKNESLISCIEVFIPFVNHNKNYDFKEIHIVDEGGKWKLYGYADIGGQHKEFGHYGEYFTSKQIDEQTKQ